jgi:uncharacterized membrane protein/rubredoxin
MRKWKCKVCGYIHEGNEAPEKCPVCNADRIHFVEVNEKGDEIATAPAAEAKVEATAVVTPPATLKEKLIRLMLRHHLHPISVHFPNGLLPASVVFLVLGILFGFSSFNEAGFYNMVFVLVNMPVVMLSGYLEWQRRYKGAKTVLFLTKIACSIVVLVSLLILVTWRFVNPAVTDPGAVDRLIYLSIAGAMLAAAGIAGFLGGKLVFDTRER